MALEQSSNSSSRGETIIIADQTVISDIGWRWTQETFDERLKDNPYLIHWTGHGRPRYKIFESKHEIIRVQDPDTGEWQEQWTGDYVFENEWQSFRTKKDRSLELTSVAHECDPRSPQIRHQSRRHLRQ